MEPVFIVGCSRTGSSMLEGILQEYTDIAVAPELHFFEPFWLRADCARKIQKKIGPLTSERAVDALVDMMFEKKFFGIFWEQIEKHPIDKPFIRETIARSDRSLRSIFDAILSAYARGHNKKRRGAKFPFHHRYTHLLLQWYPKCRIIHTARDPRAIFSSQYHKRTAKKASLPGKVLSGALQFVHITYQYHCAARVHAELKGCGNYFLCKYEQVVSQPEHTIQKLCTFLSVPFTQEMLKPASSTNSSYTRFRTERAFNPALQEAWRMRIPGPVAWAVAAVNGKAMKTIGYPL